MQADASGCPFFFNLLVSGFGSDRDDVSRYFKWLALIASIPHKRPFGLLVLLLSFPSMVYFSSEMMFHSKRYAITHANVGLSYQKHYFFAAPRKKQQLSSAVHS